MMANKVQTDFFREKASVYWQPMEMLIFIW